MTWWRGRDSCSVRTLWVAVTRTTAHEVLDEGHGWGHTALEALVSLGEWWRSRSARST